MFVKTWPFGDVQLLYVRSRIYAMTKAELFIVFREWKRYDEERARKGEGPHYYLPNLQRNEGKCILVDYIHWRASVHGKFTPAFDKVLICPNGCHVATYRHDVTTHVEWDFYELELLAKERET